MKIKLFLLFLLSFSKIYSCVWFENTENYRIAMFRAELKYFGAFKPFYYTPDFLFSLLPDQNGFDKIENAKLWQEFLSKSVNINDILVILYKTSPDMFVLSYQDKKLQETFEENTFIAELLKPGNAEVLDYLVFAKQNEFFNFLESDPWGDIDDGDLVNRSEMLKNLFFTCSEKLKNVKNEFLKKRFAFQMVRLYHFAEQYPACIEAVDKYFPTPKTNILDAWALLFKALSLDNLGKNIEANYLYAMTFSYSDEKKIRCFNGFNIEKNIIEQTLKLTKNNEEKAAVLSLQAFRSPSPSLEILQEIYKLSNENRNFAPLILREINKLEDWLITPKLTDNSPSFYYENVEKINREKDKKYLEKCLIFLTEIFPKSSGEMKDFLAISIAHLHFINDNVAEGKSFLAKISPQAPSGIVFQKNIDELLVEIYSGNLQNETAQRNIVSKLQYIEKFAKQNKEINKILYSVTLQLSTQYEKLNDFAVSGLLFTKSQRYKFRYDKFSDYSYFVGYYWFLSYFDEKATISDMENLLKIISSQKTVFEKYLCDQPLASKNAYLDLKGTFAFRNQDFETSFQIFSQIPDSFWTKTYEFSRYLDENPFIPKDFPQKRDFSYSFNKTKFLKELISLKKESEKSAESCLKLANALYNCTYWGNSWMMTYYGWSQYEFYRTNYFSDEKPDEKVIKRKLKYYNCTNAKILYEKVLNFSNATAEQKAMANFMLHLCELNRLTVLNAGKNENFLDSYKSLYIKELYEKYASTEVFKIVAECPTLESWK